MLTVGNCAATVAIWRRCSIRLEREDLARYETICRQIGRVLPGFDRFDIEEDYGRVLLRWRAKWSGKSFGAHLTSDGSLRFFALVTLLNLPPENAAGRHHCWTSPSLGCTLRPSRWLAA